MGSKPAVLNNITAVSLKHKRAPGDITVMTALVRDLKLTYGDDLKIGIHPETSCRDLFANNPYITPYAELGRHKAITCDYGAGIERSRYECVHFLPFFHRNFTAQTQIPVPVHFPYPDLHLSPAEKRERLVEGRYWVVLSGGKFDVTVKVWATSYFQQVVSTLSDYFGIQCVQIGNTTGAWHPPLERVVDLRGRTNLRQMLSLIYHADGVICGITSAMHIAAALQKPCVVLAGSREAWWWEAYVRENRGLPGAASLAVPHRYLHTHGLIDCRIFWGCWRKKVVSLAHRTDLGMKDRQDASLCLRPVEVNGQAQAACMALITPEHVVDAAMMYYVDGSLPPIGPLPPLPVLAAELRQKFSSMDETLTPVLPLAITTVPEPSPEVLPPAEVVPMAPAYDTTYDHPLIGGKITIHVLLYGNYPDMHRTCLETLLSTLPKGRFELRIASTELGAETLAYLRKLVDTGVVAWHYDRPGNPGKYVIMRELFYNDAHPITTKWLLWLDDDTLCNRDPIWFRQLCQRIIDTRESGKAMVGPLYTWEISPKMALWIKQASWYRKRQFRNSKGSPVPNGNIIQFATGSFWALDVGVMREAQIPDPRLVHNGGDSTIGEQLWQAGYSVAGFSNSRQSIDWSSQKRRGRQDRFPWETAAARRTP